MNVTNKDIQTLKYVSSCQKGLPVGIIVSRYRAKRLVVLELAEYAPPALPMHLMKNSHKLSSVRCTMGADSILARKSL